MPFSRTTATAALAASQLPKGNNSVVDLLTRVPVNRGSLVKSIENLLKTIESSENAVMIPTLLRDKVRVDAWELLFVAKILKASILGHGDLVEFYMNHLNGGCPSPPADTQGQLARGQSSPLMAASPQLQHSIIYEQSSASSVASSTSTSTSTQSSTSTATNGGGAQRNGASTATSSGSATSWTTAPANQTWSGAHTALASSSSSSVFGSSSSASLNGSKQQQAARGGESAAASSLLRDELIGELAHQAAQEALLAAKPLIATANNQQQQRQAQPPSLLQLTTTNNHINSLLQYSPDQSPPQQAASSAPNEGQQQLTISTTANGAGGVAPNTNNGNTSANQRQAELRTSRSAGCLFRSNSSGASSPRTPTAASGPFSGHTAPTTPLGAATVNGLPQSESLASNGSGELPGDPSALVKLLMQIEQLKTSIAHVSGQLESVVELYKKSIDNIST